ncbi:MAG TPA: hypothetical protein VF736_12015 [Pyrinomonadaceae bacterium]|jgi:hypothetical protein
MAETGHFVNEGFGWECKRCRSRAPGDTARQSSGLPRFFREGEAEGGGPRLASGSLARWADEGRRVLRCAACGVEEAVGG